MAIQGQIELQANGKTKVDDTAVRAEIEASADEEQAPIDDANLEVVKEPTGALYRIHSLNARNREKDTQA